MFYMLANIHHWTTTGEVLPLSDRFWYYLLDLPFGIWSTAVSFQMELERLVVREAPWSHILSGAAGADAPLMCAFFRTLQGSNPGITQGTPNAT
jgi:hypothetical protein